MNQHSYFKLCHEIGLALFITTFEVGVSHTISGVNSATFPEDMDGKCRYYVALQ